LDELLAPIIISSDAEGVWQRIVDVNNNPSELFTHFGDTPKQRVVTVFKRARKQQKRKSVVA
jgi:hypothetical protein